MSMLMWVHIAGGSVALVSGAVAGSARKGGSLHARAGMCFFACMLVLGVTASILAMLHSPGQSPLGGIFTCYFVATAWVTARRHDGATGRFEIIACVIALSAAVMLFWGALSGVASTPAGRGPVFALGMVCLVAGLLDLHAIRRGTLTAVQRISRHLWRMCFALFIATGSFFLGQQDVLPEVLRGSPLLFVLAFAPLILMVFWLVRVRRSRTMHARLMSLDERARVPRTGATG